MEKRVTPLVCSHLITISPNLTSFSQLYFFSCLHRHAALPNLLRLGSVIPSLPCTFNSGTLMGLQLQPALIFICFPYLQLTVSPHYWVPAPLFSCLPASRLCSFRARHNLDSALILPVPSCVTLSKCLWLPRSSVSSSLKMVDYFFLSLEGLKSFICMKRIL